MSAMASPAEDRGFLLVHDGERRVTEVEVFDDLAAAERAYDVRDRGQIPGSHLDIVLVAAPDLETIKVTHGSYFRGQHIEMVEPVRR
jgi:hypothetical protein